MQLNRAYSLLGMPPRAACRSAASAQQPAIPPTGFAGLDQYRASRIAVFTDDYGQLARYRDANAALKPPAPGENRVVFFGDSITDIWKLGRLFPRQALRQSRHRRADHAADAGALPPGCHRPASQGGCDSGRHQ